MVFSLNPMMKLDEHPYGIGVLKNWNPGLSRKAYRTLPREFSTTRACSIILYIYPTRPSLINSISHGPIARRRTPSICYVNFWRSLWSQWANAIHYLAGCTTTTPAALVKNSSEENEEKKKRWRWKILEFHSRENGPRHDWSPCCVFFGSLSL